jgi:hypothetical protein
MNTHPPKKQPTAINEPHELQDQIRERAYELYEERGREDGHDENDWLRAKRRDHYQEIPNRHGLMRAHTTSQKVR